MDDFNKSWETQVRIERDIDYLVDQLDAIGDPRTEADYSRVQAILQGLEERRRILNWLETTSSD